MGKAKTSQHKPNVEFKVHGSKQVNPDTFGFWTQALDYAVTQAWVDGRPVHIDVYCTKAGWRTLEKYEVLPSLDEWVEAEDEFPELSSRAPYNARFTIQAAFSLGKLP